MSTETGKAGGRVIGTVPLSGKDKQLDALRRSLAAHSTTGHGPEPTPPPDQEPAPLPTPEKTPEPPAPVPQAPSPALDDDDVIQALKARIKELESRPVGSDPHHPTFEAPKAQYHTGRQFFEVDALQGMQALFSAAPAIFKKGLYDRAVKQVLDAKWPIIRKSALRSLLEGKMGEPLLLVVPASIQARLDQILCFLDLAETMNMEYRDNGSRGPTTNDATD